MAEYAMSSSPATPVMRRSFTMPIRPSSSSSTSSTSSPDTQIETLYQHSSARVVSLTAISPANARRLSSTDLANSEEEAGSLSWTSTLERTIAVGPLRIYRAPGSVAFLSCGGVIQAILPKSRCWCVEETTGKFILQKRKPQYWRIEVPNEDKTDTRKTDELKDVFSQVLLFEKTTCPFRRNFSVELPAIPITPIKYRPWKPRDRLREDIIVTSRESSLAPGDESGDDYFTAASDDNDSQEGNESDATDDTNVTPRNSFPRSTILPFVFSQDATRSITAPPQLTLVTSPPSKGSRSESPMSLPRIDTIESISSGISSSADSFHSVQSWHSPITPLPLSPPQSNPASPTMFPYPHDTIKVTKRSQHARDVSEMTAAPESPLPWHMSNGSSSELDSKDGYTTPPPPKTPTLIDDIEDNLDEEHFEISTPPTIQQQRIRHRPTTGSNSRRRELSPLPPAANIFSPSRRRRPRHMQTARHLPTAILQKTCEILLSPPSHLLHLMLDIAAKIAAGEWRGVVFGFSEGGEKIVGQWDYSDGELVGEGWGEDDYGVRLQGSMEIRRRPARRTGESWEID